MKRSLNATVSARVRCSRPGTRSREQDIVAWLRALHSHPELGFEETRTAAFVAARPDEIGLAVTTGIGCTGVVGVLSGQSKPKGGKRRTIALRAERGDLPGSVVFIFQPAEELLAGARAMLADGLFDRFLSDEN